MQINKWKLLIATSFIVSFLLTTFTATQAEQAITHANVVWEMTDIVVQENIILKWEVDKNALWNCNPQ